MRKHTLASFGLTCAFVLAAIFAAAFPASAAKNDYGTRITYAVPFDFYIGNKKMTAGSYEVQRVSETVYRIYSATDKESILVAAQISTNDDKQVQSAKLVFNRYGQHNFLRRVYTQTRANGHSLNESKTERRVRKERESDDNLAKKAEVVEIKAE
jgi:hypothetical protein